MRFPLHSAAAAVLSLVLLAALPAASHAGGYAVSACFGPENGSWAEWEPSRDATAYVACPGGVVDPARPQSGEGMVVRNVVGPRVARRGVAAALTFDAPAGTTIAGLDFDARLLANPGWTVGVLDATHGAWLWCGEHCLTTVEQWVHKELRGLATQRIEALVRCDAARCRRDARHGLIALRHVRVHLADDSAPSLGGVRGGLAGDGWLRGVHDIAYDAADNSGIRAGRVELDGRPVHEAARGCDDTRPVPCQNGAIGVTLDTRTWADGVHALRLGAMDGGGNWTWVARTVRSDNTAPGEPAPTLVDGAGWNRARTRTVSLPLPGGQAAPLVRARVKACRLGGGCADTVPALSVRGGSATAPVQVPAGPGEYAVRVALEDAAGNVGAYAAPFTLRFDDAQPGAPDVSAADRWQNGAALPLDAEGVRPVSGIRGYRVRLGGREAVVATSLPLAELPEGGTPVEVRTLSGSGVESTAVRTMLRLDRTAPVLSASGVPAPEAWSRVPVRIDLRARDQAGLSGVQSLGWSLDGGAEERHAGDEGAIEIGTDGRHTVSFRAVDGAGNASARQAAAVRVDRTPPETVAFEAPDPADPTRVRVVVADATSGVASGRIELRRAGGSWQRLAGGLEGGGLTGRLDDATLRAGAYELRAVVADVAGNEAIGTRRADGAAATVTLPLRRLTSVSVRRSGRTLRARLTAAGRPLAGRELALTQRLRGRRAWRTVCGRLVVVATRATSSKSRCGVRTDGAGRIEVRLPAGPSRTLRVAFAGDALLLPARAGTTVRTPARVRFRARPSTLPAGATVRFHGRLLGGHVPRAGKLVEIQAQVGAGWRTFATVRSDRRGRFHHVHRFAAVSGGRSYRFRLRIPREAAYPFGRSTSRSVTVNVT